MSSFSKNVSELFSVLSVANCSFRYAATSSSLVDLNFHNALKYKISSVLSRGFSSRSIASLSFGHVFASKMCF